MTDKAEFTLVREPTAADIIALFEQIKGRKATARERQDIETEMARREMTDEEQAIIDRPTEKSPRTGEE